MGNWINKEWSQIEALSGDEELSNSAKKLKLKTTSRKRLSLNNSNESNSSSKSSTLDVGSTPVGTSAPKLMISDFDPRSPSNGIVRTPICFVDNDKTKKLSSISTNESKFPVFDPRSPTNEYNRTPIHFVKEQANNENETDVSLNVSVASFSLDTSSLVCSDSSMLLQQVPDNCLTNTSNIHSNSASQTSADNITPSKLHKLISSNLPRHILQRKQVAKLNKKKLIEETSQDKENKI